MNKKGMALVPLILGAVFVVIFIGVMYSYVIPLVKEKFFGEKGLIKSTTEEEAGIITGTTKKGVATKKYNLEPEHDLALRGLTSEIIGCWEYMRTGKMNNYRHANMVLPRLPTGITQTELVREVRKYDVDAADVLNANWKTPYDKGNILTPGTYLLCCDYNSVFDSTIFLTTDMTFKCE
ncbi:MAG: hypothetical protein NTW67_06605 [Candidatus Woesearchaeota archaeon]|nr:hypothetical protein [Candidatus Woesearchaeota archaeon]